MNYFKGQLWPWIAQQWDDAGYQNQYFKGTLFRLSIDYLFISKSHKN